MIAYFCGRFVPDSEIRVSPRDRGFLFGDGVYEVIRLYGGRPFALEAHRRRLERSLREIRVAWPESESVSSIVDRLVTDNGLDGGDALVYLQVTRGAALRTHAFPEPPVAVTSYAAISVYEAPDSDAGVAAITVPDVRWARCDIKAVGLLPNVLAMQRAREAGAAEAVFVRDGVLTEGTHTNLCAVAQGRVITHPLTNHVLPGVTRSVVKDLCRELGLEWLEEPVHEHEVGRVDELFLVGTTMEVTSIVRLDSHAVGDGRPGPRTGALRAAYRRRTGR